MTPLLLDFVVERLRSALMAGDPLSIEFATWLGVHQEPAAGAVSLGTLWTPRDVAIVGLQEANGRTPTRPFATGLASLRKREFFVPHSPGVFEADPLAILAVAIRLSGSGDQEACKWIGEFAARAALGEADEWRLGLLAAAEAVVGREAVGPPPADLAAALASKGVGRVDSGLAARALNLCLSLDEPAAERAAVRLAALRGLTVAATLPLPGGMPAHQHLQDGTMRSSDAPIVFISYTHDTPTHDARVLALAQQLRLDGIDCRLDQFVNGSPSEGWPLWMERQIAASHRVLVICSATYLRRYEGRELKGTGLGATWEAVLTRQELYEGAGVNDKFIPVLLEGGTGGDIPKPLRPYTRYVLMGEYEGLYRALTDQPAVVAAPVGARRTLPPNR